jgi:hypothetical protein
MRYLRFAGAFLVVFFAAGFFAGAFLAAGFFAGAFFAAGFADFAKVVLLSLPDRESTRANIVIQIAG